LVLPIVSHEDIISTIHQHSICTKTVHPQWILGLKKCSTGELKGRKTKEKSQKQTQNKTKHITPKQEHEIAPSAEILRSPLLSVTSREPSAVMASQEREERLVELEYRKRQAWRSLHDYFGDFGHGFDCLLWLNQFGMNHIDRVLQGCVSPRVWCCWVWCCFWSRAWSSLQTASNLSGFFLSFSLLLCCVISVGT